MGDPRPPGTPTPETPSSTPPLVCHKMQTPADPHLPCVLGAPLTSLPKPTGLTSPFSSRTRPRRRVRPRSAWFRGKNQCPDAAAAALQLVHQSPAPARRQSGLAMWFMTSDSPPSSGLHLVSTTIWRETFDEGGAGAAGLEAQRWRSARLAGSRCGAWRPRACTSLKPFSLLKT